MEIEMRKTPYIILLVKKKSQLAPNLSLYYSLLVYWYFETRSQFAVGFAGGIVPLPPTRTQESDREAESRGAKETRTKEQRGQGDLTCLTTRISGSFAL